MFKLIKNSILYAPESLGRKDILICGEKIALIRDTISPNLPDVEIIDANGKIVTPGFIDQHVHITGAGGKHGFNSLTPEIVLSEFISCGTTTVVGLLGTDGATKSLKSLYAKTKALDNEGITAYMFTSYFGLPPITMMDSVLEDMLFIDKVLGCKVALSDERSSFPTAKELLAILKDVHVGGLTSGKKGVMHVHLGALKTNMQLLLDLVEQYDFPIRNISPTHVGRTAPLFEQAIRFAKLGGMIDITTGGTKFDEPYKQVLYALKKGVPMENMTFSSDGNAGLGVNDTDGNLIGFKKAPIDLNLKQVQKLVKEANMPIGQAIQLVTSGPARNLSLKHKGSVFAGNDADLCLFDSNFNLTDVIARGKVMMKDGEIIVRGSFEKKD
ncbi:beta-aspartyl-peptidase [Flavobacterium mesophilum]|uniref:beta-aspartyl-peptidase n=1 Tax=Flavobacterium mesophilum TaxID=3143495 RepID=UPI0031CE137F